MSATASATGSDSEHRVHGMGTALEAPTWPAITLAEAQGVVRRFALAGDPVALRWHSPRPFSAATLVETTDGLLFLKRHHRNVRTVAALAEEHAFMAHLRERGIVVPDVLGTQDGQSAVLARDWCYELHGAAPGSDLYADLPSWTPFLSHAHAHAAGRMLARMHDAAADFAAPERGAHPLVASWTILPAADPLAAAEAYVTARPALAAFLAELPWRQDLHRLFGVLGQGLAGRLATQPPLWTHNDWHPSNLLWSDDGAVGTVFDFGLATRTCALHDLATAIERTAIPWLDIAEGRTDAAADADAALAMMAGYRSILSLSPADRETLVRLLPLVHVEFALSEIDYFAGIVGDREQARQAWRDYLIGHAEWFLTAAGRAFLRRLAQGLEG